MKNIEEKAKEIVEKYGESYNIDNDALVKYITDLKDNKLADELIRLLADRQLDSYVGVNPIFQDHLATSMQIAYGLSIDSYDHEKCMDLLDELTWMNDHMLIGKEMGMTPRGIAIHDAIMSIAREGFDPRKVHVAKEMDSWLNTFLVKSERLLPEDRLRLGDKCWDLFSELVEKHHVYLIDTDTTQRYLLGEIIHTTVSLSDGIFIEYALNLEDEYIKRHHFRPIEEWGKVRKACNCTWFDRRNPSQEIIDLVYDGDYPDYLRDPYWYFKKNEI